MKATGERERTDENRVREKDKKMLSDPGPRGGNLAWGPQVPR